MDFNERFGLNVKAFRSKAGLSLQEVATRAGLAKSQVWEIENGNGNPTLATVEALSAAFGVTVFRMLKP